MKKLGPNSVFLVVIALMGGAAWYVWTDQPIGGPPPVVATQAPVTGGRITVTYRTEPKSYNRLVSPQQSDELLARLMHATLLRLDRTTGELEPRLAKEWTSSPDGLTWTLKLRDGVTFSDGSPFTSADVVFTFQALFDTKVKSPVASSLMIEGKPIQARALDASTVVIVLPAAYGPGLSLLDALPILPRHKLQAALEAGTFADAWNISTRPTDVVGLGPFVISEHVPGQRMVFSRNPKFWRKDDAGRALPYLDGIELEFLPDQNTEMLHLQAGQLDVIGTQVRFEDLAALQNLQKQGKVALHDAGVSIAPDMLWFNLNPAAKAVSGRPWLQRDELRHAISAAVDRKAIVNTVFLGEAAEIGGPITAGHKSWFLSDLRPPAVNLEAAKQMLASIGLSDRNGDGFVDDASGKTAKFSLLTQKGHSVRERSAAMIKEQVKRIGLDVDVVPLEPRFMIESWSKGEYDAIFFAVESDSFDPARNSEFWLSSGAFHFWNPGQAKPATPWEAEIDALMKKQAASMDAGERRRLFADAQRVLAAHEPVLYFAAPKVILATSARVKGASPSVLAPNLLWNSERLYVSDSLNARR